MRTWLAASAVLALLAALPLAAPAAVYLTVDEALALAFPACQVERRIVYLTGDQRRRAAELAGEELASGVVRAYEASCDGRPAGAAYFDAHRVRTLPETLMVVVDAGGKIRRIEVLSFDEPPDYRPRDAWYAQFQGQELDEALRLKRDIRPVTGATLTAHATTAAARRALALHQVLRETDGAKPPTEEPPP